MKVYLLIFTLAALCQTSFLPINLILSLVIARSFVVDDNVNYILAFYSGVLLGVLNPVNVGFWPLVLLLLVKTIQILKKLPFSQNLLTILPVCVLLIVLVNWVESLIFGHSLNFFKPVIEILLVIPFYLIFHFWEDRFVVNPGIKLKVRH